MLEGNTRIPPVDIDTLPDDLRKTLEGQRKLYGAPLYPLTMDSSHACNGTTTTTPSRS